MGEYAVTPVAGRGMRSRPRIPHQRRGSMSELQLNRVGLDMGPVGFEPTTKGFTRPRRFRREWTISSPVHDSVRVGAGCSSLLLRALEYSDRSEYQPAGSLCTFRRCTGGLAQDCHEHPGSKVPLNSSRPLCAFPRTGTFSR